MNNTKRPPFWINVDYLHLLMLGSKCKCYDLQPTQVSQRTVYWKKLHWLRHGLPTQLIRALIILGISVINSQEIVQNTHFSDQANHDLIPHNEEFRFQRILKSNKLDVGPKIMVLKWNRNNKTISMSSRCIN